MDLTDDHEFLGGVARWLVSDYLAAIPAKREASTIEDQVLRAFSGGAIATPSNAPVVEIEGIRYHVDPAAPVYARVQAVRERQASWLLDEVLAFGQAVDALASGVRTLQDLQERRSVLQAAGAPLLAKPADPEAFVGTLDLARDFEEVLEDLAKIDTTNELRKVDQAVLPLRRAADRCLALVLASLAYAPSLGEADGSVLVAGDPSPRHEFGLLESNGAVRVRNPWSLPVESHEGSGTWHVTGGLLGLDVGLGKLGLRRISTDSLPEAPVIKANERLAFTEAVVLANPFDYREDALAALVRALRAGRARVDALAASPRRAAGGARAPGSRSRSSADARVDAGARARAGGGVPFRRRVGRTRTRAGDDGGPRASSSGGPPGGRSRARCGCACRRRGIGRHSRAVRERA